MRNTFIQVLERAYIKPFSDLKRKTKTTLAVQLLHVLINRKLDHPESKKIRLKSPIGTQKTIG